MWLTYKFVIYRYIIIYTDNNANSKDVSTYPQYLVACEKEESSLKLQGRKIQVVKIQQVSWKTLGIDVKQNHWDYPADWKYHFLQNCILEQD